MPAPMLLLILFISLGLKSEAQNLVDFTYSQYVQKGKDKNSWKDKISINANRQLIQNYEFPSVCHYSFDKKPSDSTSLESLDLDGLIEGLKVDLRELLSLGDKIKRKKQNIRDLQSRVNDKRNFTVLSEDQIQHLRKLQGKLKLIDAEINQKTSKLNQIIYDSMKKSGNNQFIMAAFDFTMESLRLKLQVLNNLKRNQPGKSPQNSNFQQYFSSLQKKFNQQNELIDDLNEILQNYNQIGMLKGKISRLKSQISLLYDMIEQKQECIVDKQKIKEHLQNLRTIQQLIRELKEQKKSKNSVNNKYCEEMSTKLEYQIKNNLYAFDYTYECAEGLDNLRVKLEENKKELESSEKRLNELENSAGIDEYKKKFQNNRDYFVKKHSEVKNFNLNQYVIRSEQIDQLIAKVQQELAEGEQTRNKMKKQSSQSHPFDYRAIQQLVNQIKQLKGRYCKEYDQYEADSSKKWKKVSQFQLQFDYNSKMKNIIQAETTELENLQENFNLKKQQILKKLD